MTSTQHITDFQVMFALHTGMTIMTPKVSVFDKFENEELIFTVDHANNKNIVVSTPDDNMIVLKGIKDDYLAEAEERGFIMLYELEDDEIIRCTPCQLKR